MENFMTERRYEAQDIEPKWQARWEKDHLFKVAEDPKKKKFYLLEMLPYPSGLIHMGHVRNYVIGDVAARYKMAQGFNVLHPMGWDAFGLPAENAAIERGIQPAKWTYNNIDYMRGQLKKLGISYDWDREFATCDPSYYRWEQLIFLKMYERGLAYKKTSLVNWCPGCQTVLANEQVENGFCWRCSSQVKQEMMSQWFFKITEYAEELLNDIDDKLEGWPERVRIMQREWIGKSKGSSIKFPLLCKEGEGEVDTALPHLNPPPAYAKATAGRLTKGRNYIEIFTTRPDTLFGATFMSLACEHPMVRELAKGTEHEKAVQGFIERTAKIDRATRLAGTYDKDGVFVGAHCINPVTGSKIPVYAANFVLMEYGTGAVMAVPAHDQRDFEFAKKYNLPIKVVIQPKEHHLDSKTMTQAYEGEGTLVNSGAFDGLWSVDAIEKITAHLNKKGIGGPTVSFKLKDWCLSRQRYWGAPIPIIYCEKCGTVPVSEKDLPVVLPQDVEFTGKGGSPLAKVESFINVKCPNCNGKARRETDTMDTFVESSWYMFRYASPHFEKGPVDKKAIDYWLPVDQYIGGIEHAVGHLIYCRFFTKVMRDLEMIALDEPVLNLMTQGMVIKDGSKMSKSKGNIVTCDDMVKKYGADTVRLFSLFAAPPEKDLDWNDQGIEGMHRFLLRVWRFVMNWLETPQSSPSPQGGEGRGEGEPALQRMTHKAIKKVTEDIERYHFNTAIAAIMEFVNYLYQTGAEAVSRQAIETLIIILSPFAPHVAEELCGLTGKTTSILKQSWPVFDPQLIVEDTMQIVIQVNGKLRDQITIPVDANEDEIKSKAQGAEKVVQHIEGRQIKKIIYVPKKLVNIVV